MSVWSRTLLFKLVKFRIYRAYQFSATPQSLRHTKTVQTFAECSNCFNTQIKKVVNKNKAQIKFVVLFTVALGPNQEPRSPPFSFPRTIFVIGKLEKFRLLDNSTNFRFQVGKSEPCTSPSLQEWSHEALATNIMNFFIVALSMRLNLPIFENFQIAMFYDEVNNQIKITLPKQNPYYHGPPICKIFMWFCS